MRRRKRRRRKRRRRRKKKNKHYHIGEENVKMFVSSCKAIIPRSPSITESVQGKN